MLFVSIKVEIELNWGSLLFDLFCSWKAGLILDVLRYYFKRDLLFACLGCLVG